MQRISVRNLCASGACPPGTGIDDLEVYERNSATPETYKARKTITFLSEYTDERYRDYSAIIEAGLALCTPQCNVQPPLNTSDADIYIRDATGNVLAVYHYDRKTSQLRWSEQHLYGSARLGMYLPEKSVISVSTDSKQREQGYLGKQVFELSNHLGNVLATITDKKLQVSTNTTSTAYFEADVKSVQDYYAFGMQMPGRKLSGGYRYGFNGKENDNEVKGEGNQQDYGMRIYDGRIGKFLSVDPLASEFPSWSPYSYGFNNPIFWTDPTGAAPEPPSTIVDERGNVVGGSNTDGDLGVYRVSGVTRGNFDASKIEQYKNQGTKIGETYSLYSFQSPSTGKWLGHVNMDNGAELSISKATQTLGKFMSTHSWKESLDEYMNHAGNFKGAYDLKTFGLAGGRNNPKEVIDAYAYEASFFGNKIMPRRDQGNFFAGRAANMLGLSEATMLSGFGAYQQNGNKINGFWNKTKIGLMSAVNWLDQQITGAATNGTPAQGVNITPVFKDDKVSEDLQRAGYNQMKR